MQQAADTMHMYCATWSGRFQRGRAIIHLALLLLLLLLRRRRRRRRCCRRYRCGRLACRQLLVLVLVFVSFPYINLIFVPGNLRFSSFTITMNPSIVHCRQANVVEIRTQLFMSSSNIVAWQ